jgi:hypothetical protein
VCVCVCVFWETQRVSKTCDLILDISLGTALLCKSVITFYDCMVEKL